jgi:hypothetical protein
MAQSFGRRTWAVRAQTGFGARDEGHAGERVARVDGDGRAEGGGLRLGRDAGVESGAVAARPRVLPGDRGAEGREVRPAEDMGVDLRRDADGRDLARAGVGGEAGEGGVEFAQPVGRVLFGRAGGRRWIA